MANDLLSTLKSYLNKVADGEHTPAELANSINSWIKESTESIKLKVEEEVTRSVAKMGFIKRAEFDALKAEVDALRSVSIPAASKKKQSVNARKVSADKVAQKEKKTVKVKKAARPLKEAPKKKSAPRKAH